MKSNETHSKDTAVLLLSSDVHERIRLGIFICKKVALLILKKTKWLHCGKNHRVKVFEIVSNQ